MADPLVYSARFAGPAFLRRGSASLVRAPVYHAGALVVPSAATVSLLKPDGVAIFSGRAASVVDSVMEYTIPAADLPSTLDLAEGYRLEWLMTVGGVAFDPRQGAIVGRSALHPVATDADLVELESALDRLRPSAWSSYQSKLDAAWKDIAKRLRREGNRPNLILEPEELRDAHRFHALALIFADFATNADPEAGYLEKSKFYGRQYAAEWAGIEFAYDTDDDGDRDTTKTATPPLFLTSGAYDNIADRWSW
tara:strand:+ start:1848 stop:2603 length:756 start_codon:yes stop_codon:yes gene_type:complete